MDQQVCYLSNVSSSPSHLGQSNGHGLTFKVCLEEMAWHVLHLRSYLAALFDKVFERDEN